MIDDLKFDVLENSFVHYTHIRNTQYSDFSKIVITTKFMF